MNVKFVKGHELSWDGKTVWVNSGVDGSNIGRFGRGGVDVHHSATVQIETGKQCLSCSSRSDHAGWESFKEAMQTHYQVTIPEEAMPNFLKEKSRSTHAQRSTVQHFPR